MVEEAADRIERLKIYANVATVVITVGLGTFGLGWLNASYQDRQKTADQEAERARIRVEELKLETERVRANSQQRLEEMKNLGTFVEIALDQRLERRLRFAEYFSFMTLSEDFRVRWSEYHASLANDANSLLDAETELARAQQQGDTRAIAAASQRYARLQNYSARLTGSLRQAGVEGPTAARADPLSGVAALPVPAPPPLPVGGNCIPDALRAVMPQLTQPHRRFEASILWAIRQEGVVVYDGPDDMTPELVSFSAGVSATVQAILRNYQAVIVDAAKEFAVPIELLVAIVYTQSRGMAGAVRQEAGFSNEQATPFSISIGLSQISLASAREVLNDRNLTAASLQEPATNLRAAASFVARQAGRTQFDPPLVAAAYSAGSVFFQDSASNRWKLRSFPIGTSLEVDRFVSGFNAALSHFSSHQHVLPLGVPSFAACLSRG